MVATIIILKGVIYSNKIEMEAQISKKPKWLYSHMFAVCLYTQCTQSRTLRSH